MPGQQLCSPSVQRANSPQRLPDVGKHTEWTFILLWKSLGKRGMGEGHRRVSLFEFVVVPLVPRSQSRSSSPVGPNVLCPESGVASSVSEVSVLFWAMPGAGAVAQLRGTGNNISSYPDFQPIPFPDPSPSFFQLQELLLPPIPTPFRASKA